MKLIFRLSPVVVALTLAMACGDDDDDSTPSDTTCRSPYTDRTEAQLKADTSAAGECASDTAAVCTSDVITQTSVCAQACQPMFEDAADRLQCTVECLEGELSPAPSDGCLGCYIASVDCTATNCLAECLVGGAAAPECIQCRAANGCTAAFYTCSGLPFPTVPAPPGGGAGGEPSSSGGAPNGGAGGVGNTTGGTGATEGGSPGATGGGGASAGEPGSGGAGGA